MARTIIDELVTVVEFENDTTGLDSATRSIGSFKTGVIAALAPIVALFSGGLFINSIANATDEMIKFSDATGVAVEDLQDLEFAVQRQGGTVDGLRNSIERLSEKMGEAFALGTGEGVAVFEKLGISITGANGELKSATDLMIELNKVFQGLSRGEQISFATKLGIDAGTLRLLQTAPKAVEELIAQSKEFGRISEREARQAAAFNDELTNLGTQFSRIAQTIGLSVLPALTEFLSDIGDVITFIKDNSEFFTLFGEILTAVAGGFILISTGIRAAAAASLASAAAFLANPLFLIPTAIIAISAALALLIDDFLAWRSGADSAFGGFFDFAEKKIDNFLNGLRKIKNFLVDLVAPIDRFFGIDNPGNLSLLGAGGSSISSSNRSTVIGDVNVTVNAPGADAAEISFAIGSELAEQLRAAAEDNDSSIKR